MNLYFPSSSSLFTLPVCREDFFFSKFGPPVAPDESRSFMKVDILHCSGVAHLLASSSQPVKQTLEGNRFAVAPLPFIGLFGLQTIIRYECQTLEQEGFFDPIEWAGFLESSECEPMICARSNSK